MAGAPEAIARAPLAFALFERGPAGCHAAVGREDQIPDARVAWSGGRICVSYALDVVDVDERRIEIAEANLAKVDVIGFQERFDGFLDEVGRRFGWLFGDVPTLNVSDPQDAAAPVFRCRIADGNVADLAFYEYAQRLVQDRQGLGSASALGARGRRAGIQVL